MNPTYLRDLHCPFTDSRFLVSHVLSESESGIQFGLVRSEAGEFPIVAGILRLQPDAQRDAIVERLRRGKADEALAIAIDAPARNRMDYLANGLNYIGARLEARWLGRVMARINRRLIGVLAKDGLTFAEATEAVGSEAWKNWQVYRFSMPTFLPTYAVAHLFEGSERILDFGSGVGHGAFVLSRYSPTADITCADHSFTFLALAKKYFLPRANFVCLDGDYPLPFESRYFTGVFSSDALHCVESKAALAREFQRVVSSDGIVALPHLHSSLASTKFGKSMTPSGYGELFREFEHRVIPENVIVGDCFQKGCIDLERQYGAKEVAKADGVSVLASRNKKAFRIYKGLWERRVDVINHPIINPVYKVTGGPGRWVLVNDYENAHAFVRNLCPTTVELEWALVDSAALSEMRKKSRDKFLELARALVVLDAPSSYLPERRKNY